MVIRRFLLLCLVCVGVSSCASTSDSLYTEIGGENKVAEIVDNFIYEIEYDPIILAYFEGSDIGRFRTKLIEQLCMVTGGPCSYSGDSMEQVHGGMNITETDFNRTVDLLISAMNRADVSHRHQNRILAQLAPMRSQMLYK